MLCPGKKEEFVDYIILYKSIFLHNFPLPEHIKTNVAISESAAKSTVQGRNFVFYLLFY